MSTKQTIDHELCLLGSYRLFDMAPEGCSGNTSYPCKPIIASH